MFTPRGSRFQTPIRKTHKLELMVESDMSDWSSPTETVDDGEFSSEWEEDNPLWESGERKIHACIGKRKRSPILTTSPRTQPDDGTDFEAYFEYLERERKARSRMSTEEPFEEKEAEEEDPREEESLKRGEEGEKEGSTKEPHQHEPMVAQKPETLFGGRTARAGQQKEWAGESISIPKTSGSLIVPFSSRSSTTATTPPIILLRSDMVNLKPRPKRLRRTRTRSIALQPDVRSSPTPNNNQVPPLELYRMEAETSTESDRSSGEISFGSLVDEEEMALLEPKRSVSTPLSSARRGKGGKVEEEEVGGKQSHEAGLGKLSRSSSLPMKVKNFFFTRGSEIRTAGGSSSPQDWRTAEKEKKRKTGLPTTKKEKQQQRGRGK